MLKKINKKNVAYSLAMGLLLTFAFSVHGALAYSNTVQESLASDVIRFHVRANSNTDTDQNLKVMVKDKILEHFKTDLQASQNRNETKIFLAENISAIEEFAKKVIREQGYNYNVNAFMTNEYFPTKAYGDVKLPAGDYDALRIDIGNADGNNWWCVMFPPLCFVDVSLKEIPKEEKEQLKNILTDDEFELITSKEETVKIKFKVVELIQEFKAINSGYALK